MTNHPNRSRSSMHRGICQHCGGTFWETSPGARGEDICDSCEELRTARQSFPIGGPVQVGGRVGITRSVDGHGVHVEFCDCPEIGTWAHHPDTVTALNGAS